MKKLKLLLALSAFCTGLQSQPLTGIDTYLHPGLNVTLSDGHLTSINTNGFVLAGYQPSSASGSDNIIIDKTDTDGKFNGTPGEFANVYSLLADNGTSCGNSIGATANCYGVSILEVNVATSPVSTAYVAVASFDEGTLFLGLDSKGNILNTFYYAFPVNGGAVPSKPLIARSVISNGKFYIAGSYTDSGNNSTHMYAILCGAAGGLGFTADYDAGPNTSIVPSAILESPYSGAANPQIAVVGTFNDGSANLNEGFFSRLDGGTGAVVEFHTIGSGGSSNEQCLSLAIASSPAPGSTGYIVGGYSDVNISTGTAWMMKIKQTSGGSIWSDIIKPSGPINQGVVGVTERFSSFYSQYEYYGTAICNNGMTVFKLDNNGALFSQTLNTNNEFIFNDNSGSTGVPAAVDYADVASATAVNNGVHVFGTDFISGSGNFLMARACFNGVTGSGSCSNINLNALPTGNISTGPNTLGAPTINTNPGLQSCNQYQVSMTFNAPNITNPCDATALPAGGNQSRSAAVTGIAALSQNSDELSVSPNPVNDKLVIAYTAEPGSEISVSVTSSMGQVVKTPFTVTASQNKNETTLDLSQLNIESGVYFVTIKRNGLTSTRKIVYAK